jgi:hypothetical protein
VICVLAYSGHVSQRLATANAAVPTGIGGFGNWERDWEGGDVHCRDRHRMVRMSFEM